ncbi:MAG: putative sulfate/molybdate transporter [Gemmatimonadales bacterium]|jgi:SulP family sulfate permease
MTTFRFDRMEAAGSLGNLGTLLPLAVGMIVLNGLSATSVFLLVGLFYILAGLYFQVPAAVEPMKAIGAYAVALGLTPLEIQASCLWMGGVLLLLGVSGLIEIIQRFTPKSAVRGVQLVVGVLLLTRGLELMVEPDVHMQLQDVLGVPLGPLVGALGLIATLLLLDNRRVPAAMVILIVGIGLGLLFGKPFEIGVPSRSSLLSVGPYGWPSPDVFWWVLPILVLPQLPVTVGNAILSNVELSRDYFREKSARVTNRSVSISMGLANCAAFVFGGMPMCHGAGGLAAHYRFGARTAGSNVIIGGLLVLLALGLGERLVRVLNLIPDAILGVLLVFAGIQLALMIRDLADRRDLFVALLMLGLGLALNLAVAFLAGVAAAYLIRLRRIRV